jgi:hypothetical protein
MGVLSKDTGMFAARRAVLAIGLLSLAVLAGCSSFRTAYEAPIPAEESRGWRVVDVQVTAPETLSVSEARSLVPPADIVWREDPPGDRRAQVAAVVRTAALEGTRGLRGPRPVVLQVTLTRFHALTFEAETRVRNAGVHNIEFVARVVDARSGAVVAGPDAIEASLPALAGTDMTEARLRGETQRSQITAHLAAVFAGWLGVGPDPRKSFSRLGA